MSVARQHAVLAVYEKVPIYTAFYADLIVEGAVIIEIEAVETIAPVHKMQLPTYLKIAAQRLGPLINFNVALIKVASLREARFALPGTV